MNWQDRDEWEVTMFATIIAAIVVLGILIAMLVVMEGRW